MADVKFSDFTTGGEMQIGDIPVGLRPSSPTLNFQFDFPGTGIKDSSGNYLFRYETAGALSVNYLKLINSLTGTPVLLTAGGSDPDIDIAITPIGTGALILDNLRWPTSDGLANTFIYTDGAGQLGFTSNGFPIVGVPSAVLITNASADALWSSTLTDGQLIIGNTGNTPTAATLTAGTNVSITNGAGSITISASGMASFTWNLVSGVSQNMSPNNGYVANNAGLVTLNLPASSVFGDAIIVIGKGAGGWLVQCGVGQTIVVGSSTTSSGGAVASTNAKDAFFIICTAANTEWTVASAPQSAGLTIT